MKAVKLYEIPSNSTGVLQLCSALGFDTLFLGRNCLCSPEFIYEAKENNFKINIIEPVFLADSGYPLEKSAKKRDGSPAVKEWVRFACPSDTVFLDSFFERIQEDANLPVDSMSFDFLRFFEFWESINLDETNTDYQFTETCFCPDCVKEQEKFVSPGHWRCDVVERILKKAAGTAKKLHPGLRIGIHTVPWQLDFAHGALMNVLGQNLERLSLFADFITPMIYHQMIGKNTEYIQEYTSLLLNYLQKINPNIEVIPSIQVSEYYTSVKISEYEFEDSLEKALLSPSRGVVLFQLNDILADKDKEKIIKRLCNENM